jgi:hypothetical protein
MSQPPDYTPATDFSEDEANNAGGRSTVRTANLDAEHAAIAASINAINDNLSLNQRDDGEIRDQRVKSHTLSAEVLAMLTAYGATPRGAWLTATSYAIKDLVSQSGNTYMAVTAHTSGTFSTDLAAGRWILFTLGVAIGAGSVTFTPTATISATNTQTAIEEVDTELRALVAAAIVTAATASEAYTDDLENRLLGTASAAVGAGLVGLYDPSDFFAATTVYAALAELGASRKKLVDVSQYPWLADMTGATDSTWAVHLADVYAASIGAQLYVPAGTLMASIVGRRNKFGLIGAGNALTTIKTPDTTFAISSVSRAATKVVTVVCSSTATLWVDAGVKLSGVSDTSFNFGYIVTAIDSSTQFKCYAEDGSAVVASSSGGVVSYANAVEVGKMAMANAATAYTGVTLRGFTVDGNKASRAAVGSDLTDWGVAITACSELDVDVWAYNCHNGGTGGFINSNKGRIVSYSSACGNATYSPCGFDLNSSKYLTLDIVDVGSHDGARILDNCWGVNGRVSSHNATRYGFVMQNQASPSANVSHTNNLDISVYTAGNHGVIIGEGVSGCNFKIATHTVGAVGVYLTNATTTARQVRNCTFSISTRSSQNQGFLCYGYYNTITFKSHKDGLAGAAGSYYALDLYGTGNTIDASVFDDVAQVRGVVVRSGAADNKFTAIHEAGVLSTFSSTGTNTQAPDESKATAIVTGSTYTVLDSDGYVLCSAAGTVTLTLPSASTCTGKSIMVRTSTANTVVSASSNVIPITAGGGGGTAILAATAGKWALLRSNGSLWVIQSGN